MITVRQAIVDEVRRRLGQIQIVNGWNTDLGLGAIDEWPTAYQAAELPALGVFDLVNVTVKESIDEKRIPNRVPIQVRIFLERSPTPATVRLMLADVMRAVVTDPDTGNRDFTLGGIAVDMLPDEEGFIVPNETFSIDGAAVGFSVHYLTPPFSAYQ